MRKFFLYNVVFAAVTGFAIFSPAQAQTQNSDQCNTSADNLDVVIADDHGTGDGLAIHTCSTTATGMKYTFRAMGVCNGFPLVDDGLSNCYNVLAEDLTVDMLADGDLTGDDQTGFMPPAGDYTHYFALVDHDSVQVSGVVGFKATAGGSDKDYASINVSGGSISFDEGNFCKPTGSFQTSTAASIDPEDPTSLVNLTSALPISCGTNANPGTATVEIDSVGLTSFSARLNIDEHAWENATVPAADVNVILLNTGANVASNADEVDSVLLIKAIPDGDAVETIDANDVEFNATFSKENALNIYYFCGGDSISVDLPGLGTQSYSSLSAMVNGINSAASNLMPDTLTSGVDCLIVGAMLGEGAFTPEVTTTASP